MSVAFARPRASYDLLPRLVRPSPRTPGSHPPLVASTSVCFPALVCPRLRPSSLSHSACYHPHSRPLSALASSQGSPSIGGRQTQQSSPLRESSLRGLWGAFFGGPKFHSGSSQVASSAVPSDTSTPESAGAAPGVAGGAKSADVMAAATPEKAQQPLARMYPPMEPNRTGTLQVSPVHSVYWEESGNPQGKPVIFVHGGPGGGTTPNNRRFFDPSFYRIILMDQRGSGKSTPHACLEENTTWHLVADLEALRKSLNIDKWLVFGGSWGSTLALAYAITHPEVVLGLVLRGVFLLRKSEITWFYQSGADSLFPDVFENYANFIPEDERHDLVAAYSRRLMDDSNPDIQVAAARHWTDWEMRTSYLVPNESRIRQGEDDKFALAFARIENHYFVNNGFFSSDNYLLENVPKIRHLPCIIIQGRYDVVCPFRSAWDLHKAWPESEFRIVPDAGHSANELGITSELVLATHKFKGLLST